MINLYNPYSLHDKTILITGASSGIGKSIAIESSKLGARLIITGQNKQRLEETKNELTGDGHVMNSINLNNEDAVSVFVDNISSLDGIVYCAGIQKTCPTRNLVRNEFNLIFETNFFSTIYLNTLLLKRKKINKQASIVFISSTAAGVIAEYGNAIYSASKGAISSFAKVLALELAPRKIRVNCVLPGMIRTPILYNTLIEKEQFEEDEKRYPFGYGNPEDVAFATIYMLSNASKWMTGTNLLLDGGLTLR